MTPRRKREVERIREEGRVAYLAGKHIETNPYPTYNADRDQWFRGYREAQEDQECEG